MNKILLLIQITKSFKKNVVPAVTAVMPGRLRPVFQNNFNENRLDFIQVEFASTGLTPLLEMCYTTTMIFLDSFGRAALFIGLRRKSIFYKD